MPYLQTQAPAYHGNSGGPVLDASGRVIGTLIAGAVDSSGQVNIEGYEFVLPVRVVRSGLREHNVTPRMAPTTVLYNTGAQQAVAAGEDRTPPSSPGPPWLVVIPAVAGVGLLGTLTVCAVLRRRGRRGAAP